MKKILLLTAAVLISGSAMAQHEHFHVFRNDKQINTFNNVQEITYQGSPSSGYDKMQVTDAKGNTTTINIEAIDSVVVRSTGIPEFHVNLTDHPEWTELTGSKSDEHPAILRMDGNGMYDDLPEQEVIFRGRGNSTWNMKKKPYRFKMDKKTEVCGMKKAKSFALYMLTEKTGIGSGSVDIDEEKGMLFEIDSNYDEDYKFAYDLYSHTAVQNGYNNTRTLPVMISDPDLTEIAPALGLTADEYFDTWKNDFSAMLTAVMTTPSTGSLKEYIDIESVVNFFMVNSLSSNHEMRHPKSFKLYKDSLDGVYKFGPVWDFDWAFTFLPILLWSTTTETVAATLSSKPC